MTKLGNCPTCGKPLLWTLQNGVYCETDKCREAAILDFIDSLALQAALKAERRRLAQARELAAGYAADVEDGDE